MWPAPTDIRISILKGFTDNSIPSNQFTTVRNFLGHACGHAWNIPRVFQKCSRGIFLEYSRSIPEEYS